jgi:hypothetical protein
MEAAKRHAVPAAITEASRLQATVLLAPDAGIRHWGTCSWHYIFSWHCEAVNLYLCDTTHTHNSVCYSINFPLCVSIGRSFSFTSPPSLVFPFPFSLSFFYFKNRENQSKIMAICMLYPYNRHVCGLYKVISGCGKEAILSMYTVMTVLYSMYEKIFHIQSREFSIRADTILSSVTRWRKGVGGMGGGGGTWPP